MKTKNSSKKTAMQSGAQCKVGCKRWNHCSTGGGCTYLLGFIGSAVYYNVTTVGFWAGVVGVLKAIVWPAFLVFNLLKFLGA